VGCKKHAAPIGIAADQYIGQLGGEGVRYGDCGVDEGGGGELGVGVCGGGEEEDCDLVDDKFEVGFGAGEYVSWAKKGALDNTDPRC